MGVAALGDLGFSDGMNTVRPAQADKIRRCTPLIIEAVDNLMNAIIYAMKMWFAHLFQCGGEIVIKIIEGMKQLLGPIKNAGAAVLKQAMLGISEGIKGVVQLGKDFVNGFIEGIKSAPQKIWNAASGLVKSALGAIKQTQNSNSPAKETQKLGGDFGDGYSLGIKSKEGDAAKAGESLTNAALDPIKEGAAQLPSLFNPISEY